MVEHTITTVDNESSGLVIDNLPIIVQLCQQIKVKRFMIRHSFMGEMMEIDFNEQNAVKDLSYFILRARDDHVVVSCF